VPPEPLSPQPAVSPASGELAPNRPVEFSITPPPAPAYATEAPPAAPAPVAAQPAAAPAPVQMMTTKEAVVVLEGLLEKGEYAKVAQGAEDILAADPENREAALLREEARRALSSPEEAKKLHAGLRAKRRVKVALIGAGGIVALALIGVGAWALFGDKIAPVTPPPPPSYEISIKTDPVNPEGPAPLSVTFGLRSESVPQGVRVVFDVGDGIPQTPPFTHIFDKAGTYAVRAVATAADGTQLDAAEEKVIVHPALNAAIEAVPGTGADALKVAFSATVRGATGELTYAWDFGDGSTGEGASPAHAYAQAGTYEVKLTVTTAEKETVDANASVTVQAPASSAPSLPHGAVDAVISTIPKSADGKTLGGTAPLTVFFSAGSSRSENGAITSTHWDFGDSFDSQDLSVVHTFSRPGLYKVTLTTSDEAGVTGTETMTVQATASAPAEEDGPVAVRIDTDVQPQGPAPLAIAFDGSASTSTGGPIQKYEWDFGDGSLLAGGARVNHVFQSSGEYAVKLTVTDAAGAHATRTLTVAVA